jgi:acetyl esterase/lipase
VGEFVAISKILQLRRKTAFSSAQGGLCVGDICGAMPLSGLFAIPQDKVFDIAFGKEPAMRRQASPIQHVRCGQPPFLIMLADGDLPSCDLPQAQAFVKALRKNEVPAQLLEVPRRNHISILLNAINDTDTVTRSMLSFIMTQVTLRRLERGGCDAVDTVGDFIARYGSTD